MLEDIMTPELFVNNKQICQWGQKMSHFVSDVQTLFYLKKLYSQIFFTPTDVLF